MKQAKISVIIILILLSTVKMQAQDYDIKTEKMASAWVNVPAMTSASPATATISSVTPYNRHIAHRRIVKTANVGVKPSALPKALPPADKKLSEKDVLKKLKIDE